MKFFLKFCFFIILFFHKVFAAGGGRDRGHVFIFSEEDIEKSLCHENEKRASALNEYHKYLLNVSVNAENCVSWRYFQALHVRALPSIERLLNRSLAITDIEIETLVENFFMPIGSNYYLENNWENYLKMIASVYMLYKDLVKKFISKEGTKDILFAMLQHFLDRIRDGDFINVECQVADLKSQPIVGLMIKEKAVNLLELTDILARSVFSAIFHDGELLDCGKNLFESLR